MQAIIAQSDLKSALADVAPVVPNRPALPVIGNVLLRAEGERVTISGTNLETGITRHVGARVLKPGAITLPAKLFTEVIGGLPEAAVTLTLDEATQILTLACGGFAADLHGIEADAFPTIPSASTGVELTHLPAEELRAALAQVVFVAAEQEARPVLSGVPV
jgi:DNA polymerase III subunit beta